MSALIGEEFISRGVDIVTGSPLSDNVLIAASFVAAVEQLKAQHPDPDEVSDEVRGFIATVLLTALDLQKGYAQLDDEPGPLDEYRGQ